MSSSELHGLVREPAPLVEVGESCTGDGEIDQLGQQRLGILGLLPEHEAPFEVGERAVGVAPREPNLTANLEGVASPCSGVTQRIRQ